MGAGLSIAQMYFKSNLVACLGGGQIPVHPLNRVFTWDDCKFTY